MAGTLFVVATPIGNLEDITLRALRILKEVAAIACEDTRRTSRLLAKYGIRSRLISYFQPREVQRIPLLIDMLKEGQDLALVSDAGTPAISDPGFKLVREAIREGLRVVPIPGPAAVTAALSSGGLPTHRFLFIGFPPPKESALKKALSALSDQDATLVFYLPGRKAELFFDAVLSTLGDRPCVIARELTKIYEEFHRGPASEMAALSKKRNFKGELTILVGGQE